MAERNSYIDFFRGLMMVSVIHIHTIYWSLANFTPDSLRHAAYLFDIPIFVFISGYLFKNPTFVQTTRTAVRQFLRLYLHYAAISLLVAAAIMIWLRANGNPLPVDIGGSIRSIFEVKLQGELWRVLKTYDGNLWYIRTYFLLLVLAPLLVGLPFFRKAKLPLLLFLFLLYALMLHSYKGHKFVWENWSQVLFYALYFVLGAMYRAGEKDLGTKEVCASLGINLLLAGLIFHLDGNTLRLSPYKFPPNYQYLIYTLLLVHVFVLARPYWDRVTTRALNPLVWAGRNSLVIYLFQGAVCSVPFHFIPSIDTGNPWKLYVLVFSFNVIVSFFLSWVYVTVFVYSGRWWMKIRAKPVVTTGPLV